MIVTKPQAEGRQGGREGSLERVRQEWPCRHDQGLGLIINRKTLKVFRQRVHSSMYILETLLHEKKTGAVHSNLSQKDDVGRAASGCQRLEQSEIFKRQGCSD